MKPASQEVKTALGHTMNNPLQMSLAEQLAAAQQWWRGAGVDFDYLDEATPWLAELEETQEAAPSPVAEAPMETTPEPVRPLVEAGDLPEDLTSFQKWWCDPASPIPGAAGPRIAPHGAAGAKLMIVVPAPEPGDTDTLLTGPQGRLIANIQSALGLGEEQTYLAAALPSPMAEPGWSELRQQGLGTALAHHIALVAPERVLLFGRGLPILLGHPEDAAQEAFTSFDSPAGKLPVITSFAPDRLLGNARAKARLWHRLLKGMF